MTADEAFADGNRLFRDDLYWAALLRYRQAGEAGMVSPLLDYNMGVAHYRAGQHIRARQSLLRAADAPDLRVLAHYNLGLNAYAAGDVDDALGWFRRARDQEQDPRIRKLAIAAIARLQRQRRAEDPMLVRVEKRREERERKITNFTWGARVGFGTDDNVFRTPSQDYVDFADPNLPLVTPETVSGAYMPVDLQLRYQLNTLRFESFYWGYRLQGRYYQDQNLDNANEYSHEARFGSDFRRKNGTRERRVHSAFTIAQHDETYFDPDDGTARSVNDEVIDDRLNYVRYGPQIVFRQRYDRLSFGLHFKGQLWNYERTEVVPEYDHEYFAYGGNVQLKFSSRSLLRFSLDASSRRWGDRPSFDLDGQQLVTNPALRYDYVEAGLTARQRLRDSMWFGFAYRRTERSDRYLGYNDYSRDQFGVEFNWRLSSRLRFEFAGYYRNYDYPNAYAFNNPVAGRKTLEAVRGDLELSYRMTRRLRLVLDAEVRESTSTDTRIGYDRTLLSLGVTWQQ